MILLRGVTGFVADADASIPTVALRTFKTACFNAARRAQAIVTATQSCERQATPNFHSATIGLENAAVSAICNRRYPLVAFVEPLPPGSCSLEFIDSPVLGRLIAEDDSFTVLSADLLNSAVDDSALSELGPAEIREVRHWNPRRIGDVIFNFWD